jgi:hypothetical protein
MNEVDRMDQTRHILSHFAQRRSLCLFCVYQHALTCMPGFRNQHRLAELDR